MTWLETLKAGDEVAISTSMGYILSKVVKTTPTQIQVEGFNSRFRRKDGSRLGGDSWSLTQLVEPTEEIRLQVRERRLRKILADRLSRAHMWPIEKVKFVLDVLGPEEKQS